MEQQKFSLPQNWCVVRNKHTHLVINQWFNENSGQKKQFSGWKAKEGCCFWHYPKIKEMASFTYWKIFTGYTEITYGEFLQYVVGNNSNAYQIY